MSRTDFAGLRDLYDRLAAVASKHGSILVTPDRLCDTAAALRVAEERQKFKDWVHKYLDDHGVPHHPPGTHGAAGCRIGDRLDWVFGMLTGYNKANDLLNKGMESQCERMDELKQENRRLRQRILTAAGDDLCRLSQDEIKAMSLGVVKIPPEEEFLASCKQFHAQVAAETGVMTNCLTLAQLVAENEQQKMHIEHLENTLKKVTGE